MKNKYGWFLPEQDTHFEAYFSTMVSRGQAADYQRAQRDRALSHIGCFNLAVDIGAHVGLWARSLTELFDRVVCFEPCRDYRELLTMNAPLAEIMPYALGSEHRTVDLEIPLGNSGAAFINPKSQAGPIEMRPLDSFCLTNISFIKIDCEGFEFEIVRGAVETLTRENPVVIIEQKPHPYFSKSWDQLAAVRFMTETLNYEIIDRVIDDWILKKNNHI